MYWHVVQYSDHPSLWNPGIAS
uniref:Uncharacterized protein n=1 Tax=Arundo donax TaxID=35708 RepID=A0A0A9HLA0_ARUDO